MIDHNSQQEQAFNNVNINWVPAFVLISTPLLALFIVPWYLWTHSVALGTWVAFAFMMAWTGLGITAGYHRLFAHRAYKAHPVVKYFLLIGGTLAVESSVFDWCSGHRDHHKNVDDEYKDPYSARRGFWFSHIGWMLKNYPSSNHSFKNIPDLTKQKIMQHQHKHYGLWIISTNVIVLFTLGLMTGDMLGTFVLAGLLRLVLTHHFTFFINSLCHMFGSRPYSDSNTARDNFILAIFTWGEGYHNYHHYFQYDYRNGVKWWQYDPTKWLISGLSKIGLTYDLKRVDETTIRHAQVQMQFKQAQSKIDMLEKLSEKKENLRKDFEEFKNKISQESEAFQQTIEEWQALKMKKMEMKKNEFSERLNEVDEMMKEQFKQVEHKIVAHSKQLEEAFAQLKQGKTKTA